MTGWTAVLCLLCLAAARPGASAVQDARTPDAELARLGVPFRVPKSVDEFMTAVVADSSGYYLMMVTAADPRTVETFLRAAQKQAPGRRLWAADVSPLFHADRNEGQRRQGPARVALFQHAFQYLQEWHDLTAPALKKSPADEKLAETLIELKKNLALAALEAGHLGAARKHALEALALRTDPKHWDYGNVVHNMNQILGRAALREGKGEEAKRSLLAAGATPGSPQLGSYGPDYVLARELLVKGERDVVIAYLELVGKFWARDDPARPRRRALVQEHAALLAKWKEEIRAGRIPTDVQWR